MPKRLRDCTEPFRAAVERLSYLALAVTVIVPGSDDSLLVSALAVWAQANRRGPGCRRVFSFLRLSSFISSSTHKKDIDPI